MSDGRSFKRMTAEQRERWRIRDDQCDVLLSVHLPNDAACLLPTPCPTHGARPDPMTNEVEPMGEATCNREWDAEDVGLLACDLRTGHGGAHQCRHGGRIYSSPNLDHLEDCIDKRNDVMPR